MDNSMMDFMNNKMIVLDTPVIRGEQVITELVLRKPKSGELRGLKLMDVLNMDVTAVSTLLPRISDPVLTSADIAAMDLADLTQCCMAVTGFLVPKAAHSL